MEPSKRKTITSSIQSEHHQKKEKESLVEKTIPVGDQLEQKVLSSRATTVIPDNEDDTNIELLKDALKATSNICLENGSDNLRKNKKDTSRSQIIISGLRRRFNIIHGKTFPIDFCLEEYAKEIKKLKVGNCLEQSLYATKLLLDKGVRDLRVVKFGYQGEHACLLIGKDYADEKHISEMKDVMICDPWSGIVCIAPEYQDTWVKKMHMLAVDHQVFLKKWISTDHPKWLAVPELPHQVIASWLITSASR